MNRSFWQNETPINIELTENSKDTYNFVIVGGGLSGFSLAYWLEKRFPDSSILIVEKNHPAFGASGRNAGFLTKGSFNYLNDLIFKWGKNSAKKIWTFSQENLELVQKHFEISSSEHFQNAGSLTYLNHEIGNQVFEVFKELNIPFQEVNKSDLENKFYIKNVQRAFLDRSERSINPITLLNLILRELKNTHIKIATATSFDNNSLKLDSKQKINFKNHLFLCCQTGMNDLVGKTYSFEPAPNDVVVTKPIKEILPGNYYDSNHMGYFRQLSNGRLIIGGYRPKPEKTFREKLTNYLMPVLNTSIPIEIEYQWSGSLNLTNSKVPYVENILDNVNISVFSGFSGHGLGLIFNSARFAVDKLGESYSLANHFGIKD